jgi:calcium/proton exchanger cax
MDLVFSRAEIIAVMFAVFIVNQIAAEGKSTWFGGVQLLVVYAIIAISCYFIP